MNRNMSKQAEKHFNGRLWSVLILSVLLFCAGIFIIWSELREWKIGSGALLLPGSGCILLGIWGGTFSIRQRRRFPDPAVILWHSPKILVQGWLVVAGAAVSAGTAVLAHMNRDESRTFFMMLSLLLFSTAVFLFFVYRKSYILLCNDRIEYRFFFRKRHFYVLDVRQIRVMKGRGRAGREANRGYRFLDEDGIVLLTVGKYMVHVQDFMERFPDLYLQAAEGRLPGKQEEEQKQEQRKTQESPKPAVPVEAVKNAEIISWLLFLADLAAGAVLTLLRYCLYVMTGTQYCLLMALLPLNYLVYLWVCADLIGEGRWENDKWMKGYVSVEIRWGILILQNLLSVLPGLMVSMQCVRGGGSVFCTGFVIFLILSMITVWRFGVRRSRMRVLLFIIMMTGMLCWSVTPTLFLAASGPRRHRPVEVTRVEQSGGRFGSHYAFVLWKKGRERKLRVDSFTYRRLKQGGVALLHSYDSLFDTEFVYLWANPPE